jgi:hypothetical protein
MEILILQKRPAAMIIASIQSCALENEVKPFCNRFLKYLFVFRHRRHHIGSSLGLDLFKNS